MLYFRRFDLSSLSGKTYKVQQGKQTYAFGVCGAPKDSCVSGMGACETSNGQVSSLGLANTELHMSYEGTGSLFQVYDSGSVCDSLHKKWNTTIEFICLVPGMTSEPKVVENTDCRLIIHFPTDLACRKTVTILENFSEESRKFIVFFIACRLNADNMIPPTREISI